MPLMFSLFRPLTAAAIAATLLSSAAIGANLFATSPPEVKAFEAVSQVASAPFAIITQIQQQ